MVRSWILSSKGRLKGDHCLAVTSPPNVKQQQENKGEARLTASLIGLLSPFQHPLRMENTCGVTAGPVLEGGWRGALQRRLVARSFQSPPELRLLPPTPTVNRLVRSKHV